MNPTLIRFFWSEYRKRLKKSSLITFALFWGTLSILLLMSFGQGLTNQFRVAFSGLGDTLIMVSGRQTSLEFKGLPKGRQISLYPEDLDLLKRMVPEIRRIVPESYNYMAVSANGRELNRDVHGTTPDFALLRNEVPRQGGRFINADDEKLGRKVAFIGWEVAKDLFGTEEAIGRRIFINRIPFTVVGVLQKKIQSSMYNGPDSNQIYVPYYAYKQLDNQRRLDQIIIQPIDVASSKYCEERIKAVLGRKNRFDPADPYALSFWNTIENAKDAAKIFRGMEIFLGLVGGLTLLIGAVGVTNLMYAMARERTREIGVKLALGARRSVIVGQFMLETVFIFAKGTFWGFITAFNIVSLVRLVPISYDAFGLQSFLLRPIYSLQIFIVYMTVIGILVFLSGIFPALKASRSNPIESLRYE